jgi:hypothetical protein
MIAALGCRSRPARTRTASRSAALIRSQVPSCVQVSK